MKWFKFYGQDYLSDPKILALSACERSCWLTLLSYGSVNDNGMITFLDEQQLMAQSGISPMHEEWDATQGVLKKLEKLQMITLDNEKITILNWNKRQEISLTGYERVKRYRERHKKITDDNDNDNSMITSEENRIDKNRIEDKLSNESVSHKTLKEYRDLRRQQIGNLPMTPRKSTEKQKAFMAAAKTGIDYFKAQGQEQHGMQFLEYTNDKRNAIVLKLVMTAYEKIGDLKELIDWWFQGEGEWADYEPEQCFSIKTIERFKNKDKIKKGVNIIKL